LYLAFIYLVFINIRFATAPLFECEQKNIECIFTIQYNITKNWDIGLMFIGASHHFNPDELKI
jgi:hypothetical protein